MNLDAQLYIGVIWLLTTVPSQIHSFCSIDPRVCQRRVYGFIFSQAYPTASTESTIDSDYV